MPSPKNRRPSEASDMKSACVGPRQPATACPGRAVAHFPPHAASAPALRVASCVAGPMLQALSRA
eukprot:9376978-Pyramimonas_sp.AAC.1